MINIIDKKNCTGCSACASICPKQCITMQVDNKGFLYPFINSFECIDCGLCKKICPILNVKELTETKNAFVAYYLDEEKRSSSSSGGLSSCIAEEIFHKNGVVFGATFSDDFKSVYHIGIEKKEDLPKLQGSKYLQSVIGDAFQSVEKYLKMDRYVLFVGTGCQIAGLKAYLKKDYQKLLTVDVICHGVPSPLVWNDYIEEKERIYQSHIVHADFRNKRYGWRKSVVLLSFANGSEYCVPGSKDDYVQGFLRNLYLRDSCYTCKSKGKNILSDITLGDFWGIDNVLPDFNDDKGVSAVIINTKKGKDFFNALKGNLRIKPVAYKDILKGNPSLETSVEKTPKSDNFWVNYQKKGISKTFKKVLHISVLKRTYCFARRICKKVIKFFNIKKA